TEGGVVAAGGVRIHRQLANRRVEDAIVVGDKRLKTDGCIGVANSVVVKRRTAVGRVFVATCVVVKRLKAIARVVIAAGRRIARWTDEEVVGGGTIVIADAGQL